MSGDHPPAQRMSIDQLLAEARAELQRLDPRAVAAALDGGDAVLVDIRGDAQREADGLVPGAVNLPRNVLEWRADPTSRHRHPGLGGWEVRLILLCHEGYQSSLAAATLRRLGRDATDVVGGFAAWRTAGLPIVGRS